MAGFLRKLNKKEILYLYNVLKPKLLVWPIVGPRMPVFFFDFMLPTYSIIRKIIPFKNNMYVAVNVNVFIFLLDSEHHFPFAGTESLGGGEASRNDPF